MNRTPERDLQVASKEESHRHAVGLGIVGVARSDMYAMYAALRFMVTMHVRSRMEAFHEPMNGARRRPAAARAHRERVELLRPVRVDALRVVLRAYPRSGAHYGEAPGAWSQCV